MTRKAGLVLGSRVDAISAGEVSRKVLEWARLRESRYVAVCNVHVVVAAFRDRTYHTVINNADIAVPDGAPVAWMLRRQEFSGQKRVSGPDLMWLLCGEAEKNGIAIYIYGSSEDTLERLKVRLHAAFPKLQMVFEAPPFRPLTAAETEATVARINKSTAGLVFVGLGCPKQEQWMAASRGKIHAVMLGVGAAFDFHAGTRKRAPKWMQVNGLEWLHRLATEPTRLWKRYLVTNSMFLVLAAKDLIFGCNRHTIGRE